MKITVVTMPIFRGEVYFVELGPTRGHELDEKVRPVVIVSINAINRNPFVVTIVPGTTYKAGKRVYRNDVKIEPSPNNGLQNPTVFKCTQIKALDHRRFGDPVGELSATELSMIEETLKECLGLK